MLLRCSLIDSSIHCTGPFARKPSDKLLGLALGAYLHKLNLFLTRADSIVDQHKESRLMQLVVSDRIAALLDAACKHDSLPRVSHCIVCCILFTAVYYHKARSQLLSRSAEVEGGSYTVSQPGYSTMEGASPSLRSAQVCTSLSIPCNKLRSSGFVKFHNHQAIILSGRFN